MAKKGVEQALDIQELKRDSVKLHIVGTTPMLMHRFSKKAQRELLFPSGRKNAAEKAESLKHDPLNEFREAVYLNRDSSRPAAVHIPSNAFSTAMASAALDIPGATKAQIMRLVSVDTMQIDLFGIPKMAMHMVRSSDMNRTPDVRTRPCFEEWACEVEIGFVTTMLKPAQIANLVAAAGMIVGIGDWRPQKGGLFGKFRIANAGDADYNRIVKNCGAKAQRAAIDSPEYFDAETEELYTWFTKEAQRREKNVPSHLPHRLEDSGDVVEGSGRKTRASKKAVVAAKANGKSRRNGARAD